MLKLSCHCGQVRVQTEEKPAFIHECNCSLCGKTGARWAYFNPSLVSSDGKTSRYRRSDKPDPAAEIHFCANCGSVTHFNLTESAIVKFGNSVMGVNMRLTDERDLRGIELRYPDGQNWQGEGEFTYVRAARMIAHPDGSQG